MTKKLKLVPHVVTLTITDVDVATGELRVNLAFDPPVRSNSASTPATEAALAALNAIKRGGKVHSEKRG